MLKQRSHRLVLLLLLLLLLLLTVLRRWRTATGRGVVLVEGVTPATLLRRWEEFLHTNTIHEKSNEEIAIVSERCGGRGVLMSCMAVVV